MATYDNKGFNHDNEDNIASSNTETEEPRQDHETIDWDIFQENRSAAKYVKSEEFWKTSEKILTVIFVCFLFLVVFGTALLSRITIHILVWHIKPPELPRNNDTNATFQTKQSLYHVVDETWIWALLITLVTPYGFTMCSSLKTMCLKKTRKIHYKSLFVILILESFHSIGLMCMVFIVLPTFNAPAASVVYLAVLVILPLIELVNRCTRSGSVNSDRKGDTCRYFVTVFGVLLQIGGIALLCVYMFRKKLNEDNTILVIIFAVSALFISLKYWENFVKSSADKSNWLSHLKWIDQTRRTKMMCIVSFWKTIMSFITIIVLYAIQAESALDGVKAIFNLGDTKLKHDFGGHFLGSTDICKTYVPYVVAVVNICSGYICAKAAKTACVTGSQILCFSIPLILAPFLTPFALQGLVSYPDILDFKDCDMFISRWNLESMENISDSWPLVVGGLLLYISLLFVTSFIWTTNGFILGKTQRMFIIPMYCGIHTDMSLLLNRNQNDKELDFIRDMERNKRFEKEKKRTNQEHDKCNKVDERSKIYACATMWHETEMEMTQLLKSIFRMDKHHHMIKTARPSNVEKSNLLDYDFEAHIFFDDAFESPRTDEDFPDVNEYVKILIKVMDTAASAVHRTVIQLEDYEMVRTPYGGRLTWKLLGGNSLVCHLKDKTKIRHKKRWSQVMYMYYFLSHRLPNKIDRIVDNSYNTFLLALDGDVDFQPEAVMHLVRRMKKNPMVGAACGRIHPIGHGPLVWYQKFEYAVSHWLQKATEHVIGCVLCSPGCFSLFRGSAVMDVLRTYTTEPSEARHFIQYDQGEDRWLCTLLLKQGHRVEYCAESDALTYAPEGFNEFYNQRRRWTPSTMANILDLLTDCRATVTQNQSISTLYMAYQLFLFISSLLTPGTIFLMIVGAIIVGFPSVPPWLSLTLNLIPVGLFMLSCIFTKSETQLLFAGILSAIYSIVMLLVLVGIMKEAAEEEFCSVTTVFLCFVAGVFIISAVLHPKEFSCIMHGILYFVSIPSMSMLLVLYSLGNLHVVSWGTREVKQPVTQENKASNQIKDTESGYTLSLGKIFRCICCPTGGLQKQDSVYQTILDRIKSLEHEIKRNSANEHMLQSNIEKDVMTVENATNLEETEVAVTMVTDVSITIHSDKTQEVTQTVNFKTAKTLTKIEERFWEQLIEKYLKPLEKNDVKEKMIKEELIALRNKCCLFFFLINAFLVTLIYALTQTSAYSDTLSIKIECMSIEPISVTFTIVFGILLCVQFICMLFHRMSTLIHITATTSIKEKPDETANLLLAIEVLQRSGSVDSRISSRTEDYQYVFEEKKKKEIQRMITKERHNKGRLLHLDQVVRERLEAIPVYDEIDGPNNKIEQNDDNLRQFGHLTRKEREAMRTFLNGKQKNLLKKKLVKNVTLNENTTQL